MARNSFLIIILIISASCIGSTNKVNKLITEQKGSFGSGSTIENFLDFFPEKTNEKNAFFNVSPPACPPKYSCNAQYGDIYLNLSLEKNLDIYNDLLNKQVLYKTQYNDQNIIINLYEIKDSIFKTAKCNKFYRDKFPIPHFEDYDFGLGCKTEKKTIEGEIFFKYTYSVPSDLCVFVLKSNSGDFWKYKCDEIRPESLKDWRHGYSKGFAISKTNNMIIYWAMIW